MSEIGSAEAARRASLKRKTNETNVDVALLIDGTGQARCDTGVGFLDHMLELLARHGRFDINVSASGDLQTGAHHTVEDIGIVLGRAFDRALGDRRGITRYGSALLPMDEALALCAVDISGRAFLSYRCDIPASAIAGFDVELVEEFYRAFAHNAKITLHINVLEGSNTHHMIEAGFKGLARALRSAVAIDPEESDIPSTKGVL